MTRATTILFTVEEVNRLVLGGMPFREAYKKVGLEVQDGTYRPVRAVSHTHAGSINNLCNHEIALKFQKLYDRFGCRASVRNRKIFGSARLYKSSYFCFLEIYKPKSSTTMLNNKVQDAINAQINAEFWSAYLYLSMSLHFQAEGMPGVANWFKIQFQEEQAHATIFMNYVNSARRPCGTGKPSKPFPPAGHLRLRHSNLLSNTKRKSQPS